jgi:hypothetical protein
MGNLSVNRIDLNNPIVVDNLLKTIDGLVQNPSNYHKLRFKKPHYFEITMGKIPSESGWYIILESKSPLYVGKADDLDKRLNTDNGSRDNFGNNKRESDSKRNFIKKFAELNIISNLRVCLIKEKDLCTESNIDSNDLSPIDKGNIEKLIDIFRHQFNYK